MGRLLTMAAQCELCTDIDDGQYWLCAKHEEEIRIKCGWITPRINN